MNNPASIAFSQGTESTEGKTVISLGRKYSTPISPLKLAQLNLGLFSSLYQMGVERECICSILLLNAIEFDYICKLGGFQSAT